MAVFTVGHEDTYDDGMRNRYGFVKRGTWCSADGDLYPGGFACRTIEDAQRLIDERGHGRGWAVYELRADWESDTVPSTNGWWHALIKDSEVMRKSTHA